MYTVLASIQLGICTNVDRAVAASFHLWKVLETNTADEGAHSRSGSIPLHTGPLAVDLTLWPLG